MPDDMLARITDLLQPSLLQCGVELWDLQWDRRSAPPILRLSIERDGGVSLEDCERVSTAVAAVLDAYDPIDRAYQLEVSSPGAERPLRDDADWRRHVGSRVNVRYRDGDGEVVVEGRLLAVGDDEVEVEVRGRRGPALVVVPREAVTAGRLAVEI